MQESDLTPQMQRKLWFCFGCLYASKSMREEWLSKLDDDFSLVEQFKSFMEGDQAKFLHTIGYKPVDGVKIGDGIAGQVVREVQKRIKIRQLKQDIMSTLGGDV